MKTLYAYIDNGNLVITDDRNSLPPTNIAQYQVNCLDINLSNFKERICANADQPNQSESENVSQSTNQQDTEPREENGVDESSSNYVGRNLCGRPTFPSEEDT